MADTGQAILEELRRIRKTLEAGQKLGFGKRQTPVYVFIKQHQIDGQEYAWYQRDKTDKRNVAILERDLSGFVRNVWRYDRIDERTAELELKNHRSPARAQAGTRVLTPQA